MIRPITVFFRKFLLVVVLLSGHYWRVQVPVTGVFCAWSSLICICRGKKRNQKLRGLVRYKASGIPTDDLSSEKEFLSGRKKPHEKLKRLINLFVVKKVFLLCSQAIYYFCLGEEITVLTLFKLLYPRTILDSISTSFLSFNSMMHSQGVWYESRMVQLRTWLSHGRWVVREYLTAIQTVCLFYKKRRW